ncbi:DegV family protein [Pelosinus sp. sgz500959]|uniref:DegV family protein n=1 Tax=Pelosinus sp. sgz500959 TaxID=3242472 RepID=UPI00366EA3DE
MSHIHIVVDTSAQLTKEMFEKHPNLHSVSMKVRIGEEEWPEDEISNAELFRRSKECKQHPQTSQPAPGDFIEICKPLLEAGKEIIVIAVSGGLSGTAQGARSVAKMLDEKRMHVIDSSTASIGMVQLAKGALAMADSGMETSVIISKLLAMVEATHTLILVDTLDYLYKGGRIGGAAALFGTIFQIRPVIHLIDGKVAVLDKVRTKQRAVTRMLDELKRYNELEYIGIGNVDAPLEEEMIVERVKEIYPDVPILHAGIGSVLGAHLGPGMIGVVFQEKIK